MKVMISQPMRDIPDEVIKNTRKEIIDKFAKMHIEVVDSFLTEEAPDNCTRPNVYYLGRTIMNFMPDIDAVYFVNGWNNASGCRIEHEICREYGIKCLYEDFFNTDSDKPKPVTAQSSIICGDGLRGSNTGTIYGG